MTGLLAFCLANVAIVRAKSTSSLPEFRYVHHASAVVLDDMGSMIRPRPMPEKQSKAILKPRRAIGKISEEKGEWREMYLLSLKFQIWLDPLCRKCGERVATEGHHPHGQAGPFILIFAPICRECHNEIENNKKQSRQEGWILYQ